MNAPPKQANSSTSLAVNFGAGLRSPVTHTFATTLLIVAFGVISGVQLARVLGPQGRGEIAAALLWPGLLVYLAGLGLSQAVAVFAAGESKERISIVFSTASCLGLGLSAAAVCVGAFLIPILLRSQTSEVVRAGRVFLPMIPAGMLSLFIVATLQGHSSFLKLNFVRMITPLGYVGGITCLTLAHRLTVLNVILVQLALSYLTLIIGYLMLIRDQIHFSPAHFEIRLAGRLLGFGTKAYMGTLTGTVNQRFDQTLLAAWFPAEQLGLYSVAVSAASAADTIGFAFRTVASARIARQSELSKKTAELRRILARFWPILVGGTMLLALLLPVLIPFFYGKAFRGSILPAEILLIAQVFYTAKSLLTSAAEAFGDSWLGSKAELIGSGPMVLLLLLLLPKFGIIGAAFASLVAYAVQLAVMFLGFSNKGLMQKQATATLQAQLRE